MAFLMTAIVGFAFGAADQYMGSRIGLLGPWATSVSLMSAPWLILPFVAGWTQVRPRRAMILGVVATEAALAGYFVLTLSPMEGVPLDRFATGMNHLVFSGYNPVYVLVGLMTGALYGLLGHRWRVDRSWVSAVLVAGALCLEPLARLAVGQVSPPGQVWGAEVAMGAAAAVFGVVAIAVRRRAGASFEQDSP